MNEARSHDTRSIYKNKMHFYILKAIGKEIKKTFPFRKSSKMQNT